MIKTYWEWNTDPRIHNLGTKWRWVVNFTLRLLHSRWKRSRYPLDISLGGPQSLSGGCEDDKNLLAQSVIKPRFLGHPAASQGHEYWTFTRQECTNKCELAIVSLFLSYYHLPCWKAETLNLMQGRQGPRTSDQLPFLLPSALKYRRRCILRRMQHISVHETNAINSNESETMESWDIISRKHRHVRDQEVLNKWLVSDDRYNKQHAQKDQTIKQWHCSFE
jgi:hypothetical protein